MGFNYAKEKRKFQEQWMHLRDEYKALGMSKETIQELYDFDLQWFRSQRQFRSHNQALPYDAINDETDYVKSTLIAKFDTLKTTFDEAAFIGRLAWMDAIEDEALVDKLKQLSKSDLELLTLLAIDGYSQSDLERIGYEKQYIISRRLSKIRKFLKALK